MTCGCGLPDETLPDDVVSIVVARVSDHAAETLDTLAARVLDEGEAMRASGFMVDAVRRAYILAHALKRVMLGRVAGRQVAPAALVFARDALGKPHLAGAGPHFNLSHSGDHVALALARSGPIGVDVEGRGDFARYRHAAAASLCDGELADVLGSADPAVAFLTRWTAKEAYVKATGEGLRKSFMELAVARWGVRGMVAGDHVRANQVFLRISAEFVLSACSLAAREQRFVVRQVRLSAGDVPRPPVLAD